MMKISILEVCRSFKNIYCDIYILFIKFLLRH